ncbi:flagellin lysine-N-methylase [Cohnella suwonensis]|uniref:Flagellin lysine-N-methylase n=1 Tax=Cohnella suwonensis TaxID=696072 RepID=A0ABW0LV37_9BACL
MNNKALVPEYMRQFKCIGAECEDTCCASWTIGVDLDTYKRYQTINHPTLTERFKNDIVVHEQNEQVKTHYASIRLNPQTGACRFQEGGLCSIQAELGESYLSQTCATYPRTINEVNGTRELSASLSCPEAARLALLDPQGIEFAYEELHSAVNMHLNVKINTEIADVKPIMKHFWDLRVAAIEILQNRRYPLHHRMMQLAVLADQIDERLHTSDDLAIPSLLQQFRHEIGQGAGAADAGIYPVNHPFQVRFLNDLLLSIMEKKLWYNSRYKECLDEYLQGMQLVVNSPSGEMINLYEEIYEKFYRPFMEEHEYILENYLVNHVFSSLFPLSKNETMFEKVYYLGIIFSMIRLQLIGMSAFHGGMNPELAVKLIQSFVKNFEHKQGFKQIIKEKCRQEQIITLGHLSLLVNL